MDAPSGTDQVALAVDAFSRGEPVMVFDSSFRESETDLLWPAQYASPDVIRKLRQDCGGLLFLAIGEEIGSICLVWMQGERPHSHSRSTTGKHTQASQTGIERLQREDLESCVTS